LVVDNKNVRREQYQAQQGYVAFKGVQENERGGISTAETVFYWIQRVLGKRNALENSLALHMGV
jgi:hypothetical protein